MAPEKLSRDRKKNKPSPARMRRLQRAVTRFRGDHWRREVGLAGLQVPGRLLAVSKLRRRGGK